MKTALALFLAWVAAIAVVAALVVDARRGAIARGERAALAAAHVMEENTARTFQAVSVTLSALADTWQLTRPPRNDPAFQSLLQQRLEDLPYVRALFIVGPDGFIVHDTDYPKTPAVSLADRDYFRAHLDDPSLQRYISEPMLSRSPAVGWFVSVTERLGDRERFEGVLVAAMRPAYFEALYERIAQDRGEALVLFHRDRRLIARFPAVDEQLGRTFADLPLFEHVARSASGVYRVDGHIVPGRRIIAYSAVPGLPFVVHASVSEDAVLAEWRRSALGAAVAMVALTLLLGGVAVRETRTARRRAAQRARRAQAEKLEALGQLTGGIAHDFGNLLQIVSLNLDMIARDAEDAAASRRAAGVARRAVAQGKTLIARLLTFARQQPLELRPADLNALIAEAHPLVAQAAGSGIELFLQLAPALPLVRTDVSQVEMALLNLVVNARDAMRGKGRIVLRTFAEEAGGAPCLEVEDDGPGMSEATRQRAMDPFFTTKGEAGTGLGLPQVYGFMQFAGGSVEIDSSPGRGTRVRLRFAIAEPRRPERAESGTGAGTGPASRR